MSIEILSTAAQCRPSKFRLNRLAIYEWPWRTLKLIETAAIWWAIYHFLLLVCSNKVTVLRSFWELRYYHFCSACDLEKSSIFYIHLKLQFHTLSDSRINLLLLKFATFLKVWEIKRLQIAKVTLKIIQGHWCFCHLIGKIRFPISPPLWPRFCFVSFPGYDQLFLKI